MIVICRRRVITVLDNACVAISMRGKGRWIDDVFTEQLCRGVKMRRGLSARLRTGTEARMSFTRYFIFYNAQRSYQTLAYQTPDEVYFTGRLLSSRVAA